MISKTWSLLFILFLFYSTMVYIYSKKDTSFQKVPEEVNAGWEVWQKNNCQTCHQLYGLGGYMGPDLTNMSSDPHKGPKYMRVFIKYGTNKMPDFHLNDTEVNQVLAFLKWVDQSGQNRVKAESVHWTGTYIIQ